MNKNTKIGLIAEDESDIDAIKIILRKILRVDNITFKHFVGRGCGKIKRKIDDWANQLKIKGCNVLIIIHDLDKNNLDELYDLLDRLITPKIIKKTYICIPIEEMEAWFLADANAIKISLNLKKSPKEYNSPEKIINPKETLEKEVEKASLKSKIYLNTKHNSIIAKNIDIELLKKKCPSFANLCNFLDTI